METFTVLTKSTTAMATTVADHTRIVWCMRLQSALRTALACAIICVSTLYGPKIFVDQIRFTSFSYLTAMMIVPDATLGDTIRGCWHAVIATVQVVPLAMVVRWTIDPEPGLPVTVAALAVLAASFLVALPESTHLTTKRIAFGQIVLVCTDAVIYNRDTSRVGFMHPVHVAATTALGALACVLALLIPFPEQACYKMRKLYRVYAESASERIDLYLRAFNSKDNRSKTELVAQAKPISETGTKLMQSIDILQEGIQWERPWSLFLKPKISGLGDRLQSMELPMRGMEYALGSSPAFPVQVVDQEQISNVIDGISAQLQKKVEQAIELLPLHSATVPETSGNVLEQNPFVHLEPVFGKEKCEWVIFFFSCIDMLLNDSIDTRTTSEELHEKFRIKGALKSLIPKLPSNKTLEFAFKCSLSLGLAVLLGLIFDKKNGVWAGLTLAISFVTGRQAVFTLANTRAQGTAIGSTYGVICSFLFHRTEERLLALLPWIIFTCFLRHSKMYTQAGGFSAAVGALLVLGRKNYGDPTKFAIARLAEVFIGLSCFLAVELFLQPTRASTLAKNQLYRTLRALQDCIKQTGSNSLQGNKDNPRNLESLVSELKNLVADAELEPNFWFLPFRISCYRKLVESLSNIVDMLYFITLNSKKLSELPESSRTVRSEFQEHTNRELELFQQTISSLLKYLDDRNSIRVQADSEESADDKFGDLEVGKLGNTGKFNIMITEDEETQITHEEKQLRERMLICIGAMGFCISSLRKEIDEMQSCIKEIVQWKNLSSK